MRQAGGLRAGEAEQRAELLGSISHDDRLRWKQRRVAELFVLRTHWGKETTRGATPARPNARRRSARLDVENGCREPSAECTGKAVENSMTLGRGLWESLEWRKGGRLSLMKTGAAAVAGGSGARRIGVEGLFPVGRYCRVDGELVSSVRRGRIGGRRSLQEGGGGGG